MFHLSFLRIEYVIVVVHDNLPEIAIPRSPLILVILQSDEGIPSSPWWGVIMKAPRICLSFYELVLFISSAPVCLFLSHESTHLETGFFVLLHRLITCAPSGPLFSGIYFSCIFLQLINNGHTLESSQLLAITSLQPCSLKYSFLKSKLIWGVWFGFTTLRMIAEWSEWMISSFRIHESWNSSNHLEFAKARSSFSSILLLVSLDLSHVNLWPNILISWRSHLSKTFLKPWIKLVGCFRPPRFSI